MDLQDLLDESILLNHEMDLLNKSEALTNRFARTSDIIIQKIFRLRNQIAHEYVPEAIEEMFKRVMQLTPDVIVNCIKFSLSPYGSSSQTRPLMLACH